MLLMGCLASGLLAQGGRYPEAGDKSQKAELAQLARLEHDQRAAKAAFAKRPKDGQVKHRYVVATVRLGTATMTSEALDRKVKYRRALRLYREALKVDPNNVEAKNNKQMIEDIYRSMHRPIPD